MSIFFTSDLHFGHTNIIRYDSRPFKNAEEMDNTIIKNWNKKVSEADSVYILGDVSWYNSTKTVEILKQLKGHKILIKGNHDKINKNTAIYFERIENYCEIEINSKTLILSHYPIHFYNHHYHNAIMLYGHVHNSQEEQLIQNYCKCLNDQNVPCEMYNVGIMLWNYEPVTLDEILYSNS